MDNYYTVQQVADKAGVSHKTIRKLVDNGHIKAVRWGKAIRIAETDIVNYLAEHETKKPLPVKPVAAKVKRRKVVGFKWL